MPRNTSASRSSSTTDTAAKPLRFPVDRARRAPQPALLDLLRTSCDTARLQQTIDSMTGPINELAKELDCLRPLRSPDDDNDPRPRAA